MQPEEIRRKVELLNAATRYFVLPPVAVFAGQRKHNSNRDFELIFREYITLKYVPSFRTAKCSAKSLVYAVYRA